MRPVPPRRSSYYTCGDRRVRLLKVDFTQRVGPAAQFYFRTRPPGANCRGRGETTPRTPGERRRNTTNTRRVRQRASKRSEWGKKHARVRLGGEGNEGRATGTRAQTLPTSKTHRSLGIRFGPTTCDCGGVRGLARHLVRPRLSNGGFGDRRCRADHRRHPSVAWKRPSVHDRRALDNVHVCSDNIQAECSAYIVGQSCPTGLETLPPDFDTSLQHVKEPLCVVFKGNRETCKNRIFFSSITVSNSS